MVGLINEQYLLKFELKKYFDTVENYFDKIQKWKAFERMLYAHNVSPF